MSATAAARPHDRRGLLLGALATLLYLLLPPAVPNLDGLGYLKLLPHNFVPGHLLFMPALRAFTGLVGDGLLAGHLYDALLGGAGVALTYSIASCGFFRLGDAAATVERGASFAALGLGLSYGYFSEANDLESYAAATVALLVTVRATLACVQRPNVGGAFLVGLCLGLSVLSHLSHVLLSLFVAGMLLRHGGPRRLTVVAVALATGGALTLLGYAYAAFLVRGHDLHEALAWIATAQHGFVPADGPYRWAGVVYGLCKSLVWVPYLYEADAEKLVGQLLFGLVPLALFAVQLYRLGGRLGREERIALLLWVGPYALLGLLFFAADPERWIFILPAGWIVAAALLPAAARPLRVAGATLLLLGGVNFFSALWPAHRDAWPRTRAEATAALLEDGDLILFPGHSWDEYITFFGRARAEPFPLAYYLARDGEAAGWRRLDREVALATRRHGRIFAVRLFDESDEDPRGFVELKALGMPRARLRAELERRFTPVTLTPRRGLTVTRLDPSPTAATHAIHESDGPGRISNRAPRPPLPPRRD